MKKNIVLALTTGILFAFALPPFKTGFLAYGALIPFFMLLETKSGREAFRWGYITGLCIAVFTVFWIGWITLPGLIGVLLVWPLYIALFALLHTFFLKHMFTLAYAITPFLWTSIEYLESLSELAFPWNYIGYTQSYFLPLIQHAEFTSIYGVSFWVVCLNVLYFLLYKNWNDRISALKFATLIVFLLMLPLAHGLLVMDREAATEQIKVSIIQGNKDPNEKWDGDVYENNFSTYESMTETALQAHPDLIIWPETAMPFYLRSERNYLERIHNLIDTTQTTLLTGTLDYEFLSDGQYSRFNAANLIQPNSSIIQRYYKMKMVPFSERVPYKTFFPFNVLKDLLWDLGLGDYTLGREVTTFTANTRDQYLLMNATPEAPPAEGYQTGVAICYESVFPNHTRKYVNNGANFLIIITNDAWFGRTSAPYQHNQIAVFRAIENRRDIARCANTGISSFIDKYGRVRKATPIFEPAIITDQVAVEYDKTFYTRYGNFFIHLVIAITLGFIFYTSIRKFVVR